MAKPKNMYTTKNYTVLEIIHYFHSLRNQDIYRAIQNGDIHIQTEDPITVKFLDVCSYFFGEAGIGSTILTNKLKNWEMDLSNTRKIICNLMQQQQYIFITGLTILTILNFIIIFIFI